VSSSFGLSWGPRLRVASATLAGALAEAATPTTCQRSLPLAPVIHATFCFRHIWMLGSRSPTTTTCQRSLSLAPVMHATFCFQHICGARAPTRFDKLCLKFEVPECVAPHPFEHPADRPEGVTSGMIEPAAAVRAPLDEPSLDERPQLQRDRAECDIRHGLVDRASRHLGAPHEPQNLPSTGGCNRVQDGRVGQHPNTLV